MIVEDNLRLPQTPAADVLAQVNVRAFDSHLDIMDTPKEQQLSQLFFVLRQMRTVATRLINFNIENHVSQADFDAYLNQGYQGALQFSPSAKLKRRDSNAYQQAYQDYLVNIDCGSVPYFHEHFEQYLVLEDLRDQLIKQLGFTSFAQIMAVLPKCLRG